jgi:hypothetical protein
MIDVNPGSNKIELSNEQIQHLFAFTEKKFVRWYDLQVELVDHLASSVEDEMMADKSLLFEAALERVYKRFGIFGFAKVVQQKQAQLQRAARSIWWQEIRTFFGWPKIILLSLILAVLWQLPSIANTTSLAYGFAAAYIVGRLLLLIYAFRHKKACRKLLLLQYGPMHFSALAFGYEVLIFSGWDNLSRVGFCLFAVIGILILVASFRLYDRIENEALKLYPQAFV